MSAAGAYWSRDEGSARAGLASGNEKSRLGFFFNIHVNQPLTRLTRDVIYFVTLFNYIYSLDRHRLTIMNNFLLQRVWASFNSIQNIQLRMLLE